MQGHGGLHYICTLSSLMVLFITWLFENPVRSLLPSGSAPGNCGDAKPKAAAKSAPPKVKIVTKRPAPESSDRSKKSKK